MAAVIGSLRAELSATIAQFESDMGKAAQAVSKFSKSAQRDAALISRAGQTMTYGLTAPILAFGVAAGKVAGDFESAMNRVEDATGASGAALKAMRDQAMQFGRDRRFTATARESADVMEMLAKNGLDVTQILGGATKATLTLSAATGGDFAASADLASDIVVQFGKNAEELPGVVDRVTGALKVSKLGFDDYRLAIGQAGGVAGGLGISFEEFNTAIAATASLFASGSDAGTSFKTFLTRLRPASAEAERMMDSLGLSFFDAQGNMKPMGDIAEELRTKLGGLNEEARSEALTTIFGTDAMRTAIGLMNQGADGLARVNAEIEKGNAQASMETRMKGLNGAVTQFRKEIESLMLAIGDSGLLGFLTRLVQGVSATVRWFASLPGPVLAVVTAVAGLIAVLGPVVWALGAFIGAVANIGLAAPVAAAAVGMLTTALTWLLAHPVVLVLAAIAAAIGFIAYQSMKAVPPTRELQQTTTALDSATRGYEEAARAAAIATGKDRDEALKAAAAKRVLAQQARNAAAAQLAQARATLALIQSENMRAIQNDRYSFRGDAAGTIKPIVNQRREAQAAANEKAAQAAIAAADKRIAAADAVLHAKPPSAGGGGAGPGGSSLPAAAKEATRSAGEIESATKKYAEALADLNDRVQHGLDERVLPESVAKAEQLRAKLADLTEDAQQSGVSLSQFATEVAGLQARITELETVGLQQDAEKFADVVRKTSADVREFASGGLTPLDEKLQAVDARYEQLAAQIQEQIRTNQVLAEKNDAARASMAVLEQQAIDLANAHRLATEAAKAQAAAEAEIASLQAQRDAVQTERDIEDLRRRRGDMGVRSEAQAELERVNRELEDARMQSELKLLELEKQRQEAIATGDTESQARLERLIELQRILHAEVENTTAEQIIVHERLQSTFEDIWSDLEDMILNWKGDLSDITDIFKKIIQQLVLAPILESAKGKASDLFGSVFKSLPGFQTGGSFTVGGAGALDSQLVAFRASPGETVSISNEERSNGGGGVLHVHVDVSGANGDEAVRAIAYEAAAQGAATAVEATNRGFGKRLDDYQLLGT